MIANAPILWLVFSTREEARLASRRNAVIVEAKTPEEARGKADASNTFGETYAPGSFQVVALNRAMTDCKGVLAIKGDLANPPEYADYEPGVF